MKILLVTSNVGKTAPGIVYEKLIQGLANLHNVEVLTEDYSPSVDLTNIANIYISKKYQIHPRISKFFISLFGVDPFDIFWAKNAVRKINFEKQYQYDLILCFLSNHHYSATIAGKYISQKTSVKLAVHALDAIPNPIGWVKNDLHYKGLNKFLQTYLKEVDGFFSTNQQMLDYMLKTFTSKNNVKCNVIYNPGLTKPLILSKNSTNSNSFIYTGGIYGVRKAEYIIQAFIKLVKSFPNSELIFVGSTIDQKYLSEQSIHGKIKTIPYTNDLTPYYTSATALIDIDADIDNDVFISSKMPIYLMINRIIISETGKNSPSRILFKGIKSIIQCDHDSEQLFKAMCNSIELKNNISFDDRNEIIKLFQLENIITQLDNSLKRLIIN